MLTDELNKALADGALYNEDGLPMTAVEHIRNHARVVAAYYTELRNNDVPAEYAFPMTMALFSASYARSINHGQ